MVSTKSKLWDDGRVSILKEHISNGISLSEIAERLTIAFGYLVTKGAVSGASWKYIHKYQKHPRKLLEKSPKEAPAKRLYIKKKDCIPMMPEPSINHPAVPWPPKDGRCKAVIGSPKARPILGCGDKCVLGSSYCDFHARIYAPQIGVDITKRL